MAMSGFGKIFGVGTGIPGLLEGGDSGSQFSPMNDDNVVLQGLGKASSQRPAAIDYQALIRQQAESNRVNMQNPYGTSTWNKDKTKLTNKFSPGAQRLYQDQMRIAGSPAIESNITNQQQKLMNFDRYNDRVERATFDRAMNLLEPGMQQQSRDFEQSMATRGLPSGGAAYDNEYANVQRAQNSARENAALSAVLAGNQSALSQRGQDAGILSTMANQSLAGKGQQFGQISSALGQAPMSQQSNIDVTGPAGLAMNNALAGQQQMANQKSSNTNAGASMGAAYLMSDRRLKENEVKVGEFVPGINIYSCNFKGVDKNMLCFMADEVEKVLPAAVVMRPDGYKAVNYRFLLRGRGLVLNG